MANILGISVGTRNVGLADIRLRKLIDCRIRTFPGKWTPTKCKRILDIIDLIVITNGITDIALKIPDKGHCSEKIEALIAGITNIAADYGLGMFRSTLGDIKRYYSDEERCDKSVFAKALMKKYPPLNGRWKSSPQSQAYNAKIFEAIACAELALRAGH